MAGHARPGCGPRSRRPGPCWTGSGADAVVGFGGYVSAPAYLAARRRGIPIVVHEANPRAGLANRLGARYAARVVTATDGTAGLRHTVTLGLPMRREIASLDRAARRDEGRAAFGLRDDLPTLLVTGGSQGARTLNTAAIGAAGALAAAGVQVLHAAGPRNELPAPTVAARRPAVRAGAVPGPDGAGLRGRRPGAVPVRGEHLRRADRGRPARRVRAAAARQRRAAPAGRADRRGRRRADGDRRAVHAGVAGRDAAADPGRPGPAGGHGQGGRAGSGTGTRTWRWPKVVLELAGAAEPGAAEPGAADRARRPGAGAGSAG